MRVHVRACVHACVMFVQCTIIIFSQGLVKHLAKSFLLFLLRRLLLSDTFEGPVEVCVFQFVIL